VATLDDWNERYRNGDAPLDPDPLLVQAARNVPPGRALDLACGAGRNAIHLAELGWDVVAIDGSTEAIRLLRERAPRVDARVMDLETCEPLPFDDASFDLVAILYFLHRPLFAEIRRLVRPGGRVVAANRMSGINPRYRVAPGELATVFHGFEVEVMREGDTAELVAVKRCS
jgi:tellurite methyltransferase